jgi:asparagine synthase (glutamine-hydrolysing)
LKTFSLVFDEAGYSEQASARLAARELGTEHYEDLLTGARVAGDLPRLIRTMDQPTGDGINTYYVSHLARAAGVTAALSGLGGDELFGGYPSFRVLPRLQRVLPAWRTLPPGVRDRVTRFLRTREDTRSRKLADFLAHARDLHELASLQRRVLPEVQRLTLLSPDARRLAVRLGPNHPMLDDFAFELAGADTFQILSAWELRTYMADTLLRDSDVFSMANSLELRVPFVDRTLLEWLWPQRAWFKYDPKVMKRALAEATADVVPAAIRNRPKQGFTLPFARWMRAELRPFLDETFAPHSLAACPWLDGPAAAGMWRDYLAGSDNRAWSRVWTLAMLIAFANRREAA